MTPLVIVGHQALLCSLLFIDPRADAFDVSGGVTAEVRGGRAPVTLRADPEPSFSAILTPNVDLQWVDREWGRWTFGYALRMQYRVPNRIEVPRPIFLNQAYTSYAVAFDRRSALQINAATNVGEVDYQGIQLALGPGQALTPDVAVASFVVAAGDIRAEFALARRHRLTLGPIASYRAPIGRTADEVDELGRSLGALAEQTRGDFLLLYEFVATPLDTVSASTQPGVIDYNGETTFLLADSRIGWIRQVRPELQTSLDVGVFAADVLRTSGRSQAGDGQIFPVGGAAISGRLHGDARHSLNGEIRAGVIGFFDRVVERVQPRGTVAGTLLWTIPPRWTAGINASMYTSATLEPRELPGMNPNGIRVPETVIQATTPIGYDFDNNRRVEFGTVFSVRGSHFADTDFEFMQLETWLYVAVRLGWSTMPGGVELGERSSGSIGTGLTQGLATPR